MPDVIVSLGGCSLRDARQAAHRFLERTNGATALEAASTRTRAVSPESLKLERARMRVKVRYTKRLRTALLDTIDGLRHALLGSLGLREDDSDAPDTSPESTAQIAERVQAILDNVSAATLADQIAKIQQELFELGMQSASSELGISLDLKPQNAIDALYQYTLTFAQNVVDREKVAIKDALLAGIDAGESIPEIAQRIRDAIDDGIHILSDNGALKTVAGMPVIGHASGEVVRVIPADSWAEMVARTEVARAMSMGVDATYRAAGVKYVQFLSAEDERTCPICADLDGQIGTLDGGFLDGEYDGPPVHPGCRCTTISAPAPEEAA